MKPTRVPYGELIPRYWFAFDLRFPGQRYDNETGLFHNGFRDYHSALGRYVQSDPLGLEAGWSTYSYTLGNPNGNKDPLELKISIDSFTEETRAAFAYLTQSPNAAATIDRATKSERTLRIVVLKGHETIYRRITNTIYWNPELGFCDEKSGKYMTPAMALIHEIGHFLQKEEFPGIENWTFEDGSFENRVFSKPAERFIIFRYERPASMQLNELVRKGHGTASLMGQKIIPYQFNSPNGEPLFPATKLKKVPQ